MTDPNKPTFAFGQPAPTSGAGSGTGSGSLFGATTSSTPSAGGLFGSTTAPTASSGPGLFGSGAGSVAPAGSLFGSAGAAKTQAPSSLGSATAGSNLFSGGGSKPASGFSFAPVGADNKTAGGAGGASLFGAPSTSQPATAANAPSSNTSVFATPSKDTPSTSQSTSTSLFGSTQPPSNLFGNAQGPTGNSTTPQNKPMTSLFGNSTTPAGPPPSGNAAAAPVTPFNPFSNNQSKPNATAQMFPQATGANPIDSKAQEAPKTTSAAPATGLFGSASNPSGGSGLFGAKPGSQPASNLFGNMGKPQNTTESQIASQAPQADTKPPSNLFSNFGAKSTAPDTSAKTPTAPSLFGGNQPQSGFSFAKASEPPASATVKSPTQSGGFSFGKAAPNAASTASSGTTTNAPSLFPNLGKPQEKAASTTAGTTAPTPAPAPAPSSSGPAAPSLFGAPAGAATTSTSDQNKSTTAAGAESKTTGAANLGASTSGPAPPPRSRLKDKTMDDIITRWASDLSKYQKEFQAQAEKVAHWDRMLVENSEKIQRLYGSTLEAERATTEVERQLTAVESDQAELEQWLDHYEREVNQMMDSQIGQGDGLSGPDSERERTYQLATRISDRLEEMGQDLGSMIGEINDASSKLGKHTKPDDPLSQVVRVLNNHLTQLQQIDQGANALQLKVKEAQKAGQGLMRASGLNGPSSDAAEGFYRSFLGGR